MKKGIVIKIEGGNYRGCGKTTVAKKIYDWFKENGEDVLLTGSLTGSSAMEEIKKDYDYIIIESKEEVKEMYRPFSEDWQRLIELQRDCKEYVKNANGLDIVPGPMMNFLLLQIIELEKRIKNELR